ncbi:EF-hand domain-containing protein [Sagittula salina]|uniref:EF-hand domain-containing protein n=1 Tax=Sagittula salina TaxID=2820268 RepID=A0A940MJG6_9RHOB|nr:EF-hand domain-containing protein [Sagittula salina]MBP0480900.1 EF-hand domain-containing protein [Sagittula salina]
MFKGIPMRSLLAASVVAMTLSGTGAAFADDDRNDDDQVRVMTFGYANMNAMVRAIDVDGDGIVSAAEASSHASAGFARFDADGDDQVTEDEYLDSAPMAMPAGRRAVERLYVNRAARFKAMDADADGSVTLAEFMARAQASYESADGDKDGKVTVWEFRAQQSPF